MSYLENQTRPNSYVTYYLKAGAPITGISPFAVKSLTGASELLFTASNLLGGGAYGTIELTNALLPPTKGMQLEWNGLDSRATFLINSPILSYPVFEITNNAVLTNQPLFISNGDHNNGTQQYLTQKSDTQCGIYWASSTGGFGTMEYINGTGGGQDSLNIYNSPGAQGGSPLWLQSNLIVYSDAFSTLFNSCNYLGNLWANSLKLPQNSESQPFATPGDGFIRTSPFASGSNCMDFFIRLGTGLTVGYNWFVSDGAGSYNYATLRGGAVLSNADQALFTCANIYGYCNLSSVAGAFSNLTVTSTASVCNTLTVTSPTGGYSPITLRGLLSSPVAISSSVYPGATGPISCGNAAGLMGVFQMPAGWSQANMVQVTLAGMNAFAPTNRVTQYNTTFDYTQSGGSVGPPDGIWFFITSTNAGIPPFSVANYTNNISAYQILCGLPPVPSSSFGSSTVAYPDAGSNSTSLQINWPVTFTFSPRTLTGVAGQFYIWCSLHNPLAHGGTINFNAFSLQATLTYLA